MTGLDCWGIGRALGRWGMDKLKNLKSHCMKLARPVIQVSHYIRISYLNDFKNWIKFKGTKHPKNVFQHFFPMITPISMEKCCQAKLSQISAIKAHFLDHSKHARHQNSFMELPTRNNPPNSTLKSNILFLLTLNVMGYPNT